VENTAPILILLAVAGAILYLHLTGGPGRTRIYLTGLLVAVALVLLVPSLNLGLPDWWKDYLPTTSIQLGLDLQGGTHLLMEVKLEDAVDTALTRRGDDLKRELKSNKLDVDEISTATGGALTIKLKTPDERTPFLDLIAKSGPDLAVASVESTGGPVYSVRFKDRDETQVRGNAMDQALETIRNRIDQLGVRETTVVREGDRDILVQLPGIQDPERAKELIGKTAVLEFKLVDDSHPVNEKEPPPPGDEILYGPAEAGGRSPYLVETPVLMTGDVVTDARVRPGARLEGPYVAVDLDARGAQTFDALTSENVGRRLAIILDGTVYSAPVIKERIPAGHVQITGRFSIDEAHDLAIVLRSGALPAPVEIAEERTVGPSLGRDSVRQGAISFVVGALAVLIFMPVYYSGAGLLADFGLTLNIMLLICVMAALQATLTLPGIAGIVLTLGMSVDANVLVNERIREELRNGKTTRDAVKLGYQRAWLAIRDSNISTFVAGLILFQFGTGPVKGFAVTLCVGVLTGLFSCIVVTRAWYDNLISSRRLQTISV
jgi:preprotein translocase subunit SecD